MSLANRQRKGGPHSNLYSRLGQDEAVRTVQLYLLTGSSNRVGEILGLAGSTVRDRLRALSVPIRPQGFSEVPAYWQAQVLARLEEIKVGKLRIEADR